MFRLTRCETLSVPAVVLILTVLSICQIFAEEKAPLPDEELRGRVADLLRQLDDNSRANRTQAELKLLELGPAVLPLLPAPDLLPSAAVRETVRRVRGTLEQRKASESVRASHLTMRGSSSIESFAEELFQQTGNRVGVQSLPMEIRQKKILTDFDKATFWSVMSTIVVREQLTIDEGPTGTLLLRLADGTSTNATAQTLRGETTRSELATQAVDAFRIAVRSAGLRQSLAENSPRILRFQLGLMLEPRLRPLFLKYATADFTVEIPGKAGEEAKNPMRLSPTSPKAKYELPVGEGAGRWNVQLDFDIPAGLAPTQAELRGKLSVLTAASPERFTFDHFPNIKQISRRRGGVTVRVEDVVIRKSDEKHSSANVQIVVNYDTGGPAFESHRTWMFQNQAWMETPGKQRIDFAGTPLIRRQDDGSLAIGYNFDDLPFGQPNAGLRFVYEAPTLLIDVPVTFQFTNLPIHMPAGKDLPR